MLLCLLTVLLSPPVTLAARRGHVSNKPQNIPQPRDLAGLGIVTPLEPGAAAAARSSHLCTGECCQPLHRDRSCAWTNLLFVAPHTFYYVVEDERSVPGSREDSDDVYLSSTFSMRNRTR